jgi:hypothetical protein
VMRLNTSNMLGDDLKSLDFQKTKTKRINAA